MPPLPAAGNTNWRDDWAQAVHNAATEVVSGRLAGTPVTAVGSTTTPITNAATARPSGAAVVYWICAAGVTPTNAVNGDLIWNA